MLENSTQPRLIHYNTFLSLAYAILWNVLFHFNSVQ